MVFAPKKKVALSLDMEGLAAKHTCPALLSIGVVEFDPHQVQTPEVIAQNPSCHIFIALDGQTEQYGRVLEGDTLSWWMRQGDAARQLFEPAAEKVTLPTALVGLNRWINGLLDQYADASHQHSHAVERPDLEVWSYGAKSDLVWWATACEGTGVEYPIHYRSERCLRTLSGALPDVTRTAYGVAHNALDDAIAQAAWCQRLHARLAQLPDPKD